LDLRCVVTGLDWDWDSVWLFDASVLIHVDSTPKRTIYFWRNEWVARSCWRSGKAWVYRRKTRLQGVMQVMHSGICCQN
jgi:hypothetical protein